MRTKYKNTEAEPKRQTTAVTKADSEDTLLNYLYRTYADKSRTTVKSWLAHRQVAINGTPTTAYDALLKKGDEVLINFEKGFRVFKHSRLKIVYEDEFLIVADKGYGLLSVSTDRIKDKTAYHILSDYLKEEDPNAKLFVIHRLDRDTSGLIMYAKSEKVQSLLQRSWNQMVLDRRYVAVIEGKMEPEAGEISSYLAENSVHLVYSTDDEENGQYALTRYETVQGNGQYSLLMLQLATGRKNQIRVHLSDKKHPIIGDKRYGSRINPLGRLALHACRLRFVHPITRGDMFFKTAVPAQFDKITR